MIAQSFTWTHIYQPPLAVPIPIKCSQCEDIASWKMNPVQLQQADPLYFCASCRDEFRTTQKKTPLQPSRNTATRKAKLESANVRRRDYINPEARELSKQARKAIARAISAQDRIERQREYDRAARLQNQARQIEATAQAAKIAKECPDD